MTHRVDSARDATEPAAEDVRIIGRYALHEEIAAGGMATVHLGRLLGPAGFSRTVAIKRLHAQLAKDPEFVSMFLDEARVAARIRHPNVVSTLDVVALEGELFIVMDYVEGESLARLSRVARGRGERIPERIALAAMTSALYGLHGAHEARGERGEPLGIVHRDVSPQNILVDTQGVTRVVDFGVAKAVGRLQTTRDGQLKGKLAYMAPEQLRGQKVDARTDVFAASTVLWELLTGQRLFQAENDAAIFGKILECQVEPPSAKGAESSPEIDAILSKGLAAKPDERWESALEMAEALETAARDRPTQRELGRWVRTLAEEALTRRAQAVRELESHSAVNELVHSPDTNELRASLPSIELADPPVPSSERGAPASPLVADSPVSPDDVSDDEPTRLAEARPSMPELPAPPEPAFEGPSVGARLARLGRAVSMHARRGSAAALAAAIVSSVLALLGLVLLVVVVRNRNSQTATEPAAPTEVRPAAPPAPSPTPARPQTTEPSSAKTPTAETATPEPESSAPNPAPKPTASAGVKPKPVGRSNCNPPYTLDKDGTRIPKLECL